MYRQIFPLCLAALILIIYLAANNDPVNIDIYTAPPYEWMISTIRENPPKYGIVIRCKGTTLIGKLMHNLVRYWHTWDQYLADGAPAYTIINCDMISNLRIGKTLG